MRPLRFAFFGKLLRVKVHAEATFVVCLRTSMSNESKAVIGGEEDLRELFAATHTVMMMPEDILFPLATITGGGVELNREYSEEEEERALQLAAVDLLQVMWLSLPQLGMMKQYVKHELPVIEAARTAAHFVLMAWVQLLAAKVTNLGNVLEMLHTQTGDSDMCWFRSHMFCIKVMQLHTASARVVATCKWLLTRMNA